MKYNTTRQSMYDFWYILCLPTVREPNKKGGFRQHERRLEEHR
jgi:hypothetical protein